MVALKPFRYSGPSFADLAPYAGLVDNGIMLLKDGSLLAGWYFAGPDSESSTDAERNEVSRQINAILSRLGSGWMIQVEAARVPTTDYPTEADCHFPDAVTRAIDAERRAHFEQERGHFESRHALILTWRPPEPRRSGLTTYIYADAGSRSTTYADSALDAFRTSIREVEQYLANVVSIRRMLTQETEDRGGFRVARYDELFQFIRFCVTGENHPVRLPEIPMYLDWLVTAELQHGLTPTVENRFLGVVAIDGLPAESWPGILNALDLMPLTYRWSSRFVFLDEQEARARLERTRKKWQQKVRPFFDQLFQTQSRSLDQDAMTMVAESEDAIAEAASQLVSYGYYTPVIVLFDDEQPRLQEKCEAIRRLIQAEGFGARIETLNYLPGKHALPMKLTPASEGRSLLRRLIAKPEFGPFVLLIAEIFVFWAINPDFLSPLPLDPGGRRCQGRKQTMRPEWASRRVRQQPDGQAIVTGIGGEGESRLRAIGIERGRLNERMALSNVVDVPTAVGRLSISREPNCLSATQTIHIAQLLRV